jgi:hypothetical protein
MGSNVAMTVAWDDYEVYYPGAFGPSNTLPRPEARRAFDLLMEAKPQRIGMLHHLLNINGVELSSTDPAIQGLNDWFRLNVEADPDKPGRLTPDWYSVVNDIALFLGDVVIERCPGLRWEFYIWGRKNISYQRPVIMGFTRVPNPKYNIDIDAAVASYGHRIVVSRGSVPHHGHVTIRGVEIDLDAVTTTAERLEIETDAFCRWLKLAERQA